MDQDMTSADFHPISSEEEVETQPGKSRSRMRLGDDYDLDLGGEEEPSKDVLHGKTMEFLRHRPVANAKLFAQIE